MEFCIRLKHLRQKYKLTQGELAAVIGLKSTAISNYESKRNEPSIDKLISLSDYFNVSCDYMLGITDNSLRIGSEDLDNETADFFILYKRLNKVNTNEIKNYAKYLLYKQEKLSESLKDYTYESSINKL
ncbi:helix-turn-helix domain-containing protein [Anaerocolumna sp. MB42-C2]|uniref:helix-turn-helix domain-containing protein n=1 Tax=Anaerocolumna sp. MB42-C2 TaxID=3070997 RepID=UPI0027E0C2E3|nr:helix-turn-helix transcriptional regulator [Anaerocolumna sp. MB42-C2]WMJ86345.1 helix-turn-helix transcriptional regulator [Anaerocolumna sp. MB42-C2]